MAPQPFAPGDLAMLLDAEGNRHFVVLREEATHHSHLGAVPHASVIGLQEGAAVPAGGGRTFVALRPRLADFVLGGGINRQSGIVYPKDAAQVVAWADIAAGQRVLEAGVGSGALTLALLRAVGERGTVIGYERRADFLALAHANVRAFMAGTGGAGAAGHNLLLRERDVYEGIVDPDLDRVVLDLPEPWRVLPHLPGTLRQGGWVCAYLPSIIQVSQLVEALRQTRRFVQVEALEVLLRGWHVRQAAVRPAQQMVGHTGFLVVARLVAEGAGEAP